MKNADVDADHAAAEFVRRTIEAGADPFDLARVTTTSSGLDAAGIMAALVHPALAEPGMRPVGIAMMADLMAPDDSLYFDAIYGAFRGQAAIRGWLVPTMAEIEFIDFVPTAESVVFDDGLGGSSLDEWQMFAKVGDDSIPLSRGVSVRRYRGGWITWACDVYDTGAFRQPPPPEAGVEAAVLPPWPRVDWESNPGVAETETSTFDADAYAEQFHPTDSIYHHPVAGELHGRSDILGMLSQIADNSRDTVFEPIGPRLDNGETSVQEWRQMRLLDDGSRRFMTRGTSVRRRSDGLITYAADYFDTASLIDD